MLLSQLRGRVVVINFWASWCHPCTDEIREFVRARKSFGGRVAVITISEEPPDVAASYLRLWNIDLPVIEDTRAAAIFRAYGASPVPETVIVDARGNLSYEGLGELTWAQLYDAINVALAVGS